MVVPLVMTNIIFHIEIAFHYILGCFFSVLLTIYVFAYLISIWDFFLHNQRLFCEHIYHSNLVEEKIMFEKIVFLEFFWPPFYWLS